MAFYLKLPDDRGSSAANNWLVQVTGISGVMANAEFKLALPTVAYTRRRYYYDGARTPDSNSSASLNSNLSQQFSGSYGLATISNLRVNSSPAVNTAAMFNNRVAEDVLSFDCSVAPSSGCAAFFAQANATNAMYSIGVYYLKITDDNGVHTFNMSSSNGVLSEFASDTGQLTLKLFNFPLDNSHWVFYNDGGAVPISFSGEIPDISVNVGDVVNVDLSTFFDGTELPFVFTSIGADLSALGLSIAGNDIVGTATLGSLIGARIRGTDAALNTADSNLFNVTVAAAAVNVDSTVSATWPQLTLNANQVSAVPVYLSSVSAQWPMLSVQASQSAVVPQYVSSVTSQWPMLSTAVDQQSAVPQYTLSASVTWPMLAVQAAQQQQLPEGATTVSVTWPLFAISGAQVSAAPEYNAIAAAQWSIFAVAATQEQDLPVGGSTVTLTWPMLSMGVAQQSVAPQYSLSVTGAWPMFSVSALAGEFDYFTAASAKIVIPELSRRLTLTAKTKKITLPSLSRKITL